MVEPHAVGTGNAWPPGTTERGFVTSSQTAAAPRRGGALMIGVGALTMLAVGAVVAVLIYGRRPPQSPASALTPEAPIPAHSAAAAATVTAVAVPPPVPIVSASADTVPTGTPAASAAPSSVPVAGKRTSVQLPPPKPSASPPVKRGTEIRSPFD
jgi:hypothetical protein